MTFLRSYRPLAHRQIHEISSLMQRSDCRVLSFLLPCLYTPAVICHNKGGAYLQKYHSVLCRFPVHIVFSISSPCKVVSDAVVLKSLSCLDKVWGVGHSYLAVHMCWESWGWGWHTEKYMMHRLWNDERCQNTAVFMMPFRWQAVTGQVVAHKRMSIHLGQVFSGFHRTLHGWVLSSMHAEFWVSSIDCHATHQSWASFCASVKPTGCGVGKIHHAQYQCSW